MPASSLIDREAHMAIESELYQEIILEHFRSRSNRRILTEATHSAVGDNPLCGDMLTLYLQLHKDGAISELAFQGQGCAICCASANMLCEALRNKNFKEARHLYQQVHSMLTAEAGQEREPLQQVERHFEELGALVGVRKFPLRIKCALLAWRAFEQILDEIGD